MSRSAERAVTKVNAIIRARTADVQFARTPAMRNHTFYRAAFQLTGSVQPNGSVSTQRQCFNVERVLSASRDWAVLEGFEQVAPTDDADRLELIVDDGNARNTVGEKQADRHRISCIPIVDDEFKPIGMHEIRWVRSRLTASATADCACRVMGCLHMI